MTRSGRSPARCSAASSRSRRSARPDSPQRISARSKKASLRPRSRLDGCRIQRAAASLARASRTMDATISPQAAVRAIRRASGTAKSSACFSGRTASKARRPASSSGAVRGCSPAQTSASAMDRTIGTPRRAGRRRPPSSRARSAQAAIRGASSASLRSPDSGSAPQAAIRLASASARSSLRRSPRRGVSGALPSQRSCLASARSSASGPREMGSTTSPRPSARRPPSSRSICKMPPDAMT